MGGCRTATEEGADKAGNTGTRRSAISARAKSCPALQGKSKSQAKHKTWQSMVS